MTAILANAAIVKRKFAGLRLVLPMPTATVGIGFFEMSAAMAIAPVKLDLKRDEKLTIVWNDQTSDVFTLALLRAKCPCASCKTVRQEDQQKKPLLRILPGNYAEPLSALSAELIGNYAIKIEWSDKHGSGIYSFSYLRQIIPRVS
jgi:DUF971 family protein